ncbi:hypothetical protein PSPHG_CDS_0154 [Pseudomonas phage Psxphi15]
MKKPTKRELVGYCNTLREGFQHFVRVGLSRLTNRLETPTTIYTLQSTYVQCSPVYELLQLVLGQQSVVLVVQVEATTSDHAEVLLTSDCIVKEDKVFDLVDVSWHFTDFNEDFFVVLALYISTVTVVTWQNNSTVVAVLVVEEAHVSHIALDATILCQEHKDVKVKFMAFVSHRVQVPVQSTTQTGQRRCNFAQVKLHYQILF